MVTPSGRCDRAAIEKAARETGAIVVAEEHLVDGGLVRARRASCGGNALPAPTEFVGIQDIAMLNRSTPEQLLDKYGLVARDVARRGPSRSFGRKR